MAIHTYQADLHIHTLLSPCAEVEMIPSAIVTAALEVGLDLIAITDHNSCENAQAVIDAAAGTALTVLPGLEVQTSDGVHLLCLFDSVEQAGRMQDMVYPRLPTVADSERFYHKQMIVDSQARFVGYCEKLLGFPSSMEIHEVFRCVQYLGGLTVPSHIDRLETGICGVLGKVPEEPAFEAVEISWNVTAEQARKQYQGLDGRAILRSSDSHWLSAIGRGRTALRIEHPSVGEIVVACRGEAGRWIADA